MSKLLSISEVANILTVSDRTVRRLCNNEKIPHYTIGGQIKVDEIDLQNYLKKNKKGDFKNE